MRLYRYGDLAGVGVPYGRWWLGKLEAEKLFPKRLKLNPLGPRLGAVAWVAEEARAAAR